MKHSNDSTMYDERSAAESRGTTSGSCNGHAWVDLGLRSGLRWATKNIGAERPEEPGDYFAWGEIRPKRRFCEAIGLTDELCVDDIGGDPSHDAASANWGVPWRMPRESEFQELIDTCEWAWTGSGFEVTGPNGRSLFLPAAGLRHEEKTRGEGSCNCWSATPAAAPYAWFLDVGHLFHDVGQKTVALKSVNKLRRSDGLTVRAVVAPV